MQTLEGGQLRPDGGGVATEDQRDRPLAPEVAKADGLVELPGVLARDLALVQLEVVEAQGRQLEIRRQVSDGGTRRAGRASVDLCDPALCTRDERSEGKADEGAPKAPSSGGGRRAGPTPQRSLPCEASSVSMAASSSEGLKPKGP